jgi:glycosyltransferase involved in cell wall biosynthesis
MSNIIGMLRVKNEARWIDRVIRSIQPVCSEIHIFDDGSKDETPDICEAMGATVYRSPFNDLNECRDKNYLLDKVRPLNPEWILHIDGDEELAADGPDQIRQAVSDPTAWAYSFRILYLWDQPDMVRTDGIYATFRRESLFRPIEDGFKGTGAGGNFHCGKRTAAAGESLPALEHLPAALRLHAPCR